MLKVRNHFIQMNHFWSSVLFGPERKLSLLEEQPNYQSLLKEILLWLEEVFAVSHKDWILIKATKNPQSESFIFQNGITLEVHNKIFVKRFNVQLENECASYLEGMKQECIGLKKVAPFNGKHNIYVPRLYGFNDSLYVMVISFLEGVQFFNILSESPFKVMIGKIKLEENKQCLSNLGKWLKLIHGTKVNLLDREQYLKSLLDCDLGAVKTRLDHLRKIRPADFPPYLCEKISCLINKLSDMIIAEGVDLSWTHGDFSLSNILYEAGKITVLDFSEFKIGLPDDDIVRLYLDLHNIESYSFMLSPSKKNTLKSAFLGSYFGANRNFSFTPSYQFNLLKHLLININMYTLHWGNRQFLNPFLCRMFYHFQRKFLLNLIKE